MRKETGNWTHHYLPGGVLQVHQVLGIGVIHQIDPDDDERTIWMVGVPPLADRPLPPKPGVYFECIAAGAFRKPEDPNTLSPAVIPTNAILSQWNVRLG